MFIGLVPCPLGTIWKLQLAYFVLKAHALYVIGSPSPLWFTD